MSYAASLNGSQFKGLAGAKIMIGEVPRVFYTHLYSPHAMGLKYTIHTDRYKELMSYIRSKRIRKKFYSMMRDDLLETVSRESFVAREIVGVYNVIRHLSKILDLRRMTR